jgi:flagellar biogenesis protein FliO
MNSMMGPALRMLVSLGIVLALMYVAAMLLRRTHGGSAVRGGGSRTPTARRGRGKAVSSAFGSLAASFVGKASSDAEAVERVRPERRRIRRPKAARRRNRLEVLARQPLGKTASVAVVRVAGRTLLIGVTDTAVQLLSEVDASAFDDDFQTEIAVTAQDFEELVAPVSELRIPESTTVITSAPSSVSVLDLLRERTVRRA